jgi:hypothetical protein
MPQLMHVGDEPVAAAQPVLIPPGYGSPSEAAKLRHQL